MRAEIAAVLALAAGESVAGRSLSWPLALEMARRERLAPLAWLRGGVEIRRLAPPEVTQQWRREALAAAHLAEFWERRLSETLTALRAAEVGAVVLKGLPLAKRLYGDTAARPCADLDLYIPARARTAAEAALARAGWNWRDGEAPGEAVYVSAQEGRVALLEAHSALLDGDIVRHLRLPAPAASDVALQSVVVPAHVDDALPAFLAVHLAKHAMAPLLWLVDFDTLWRSLDDSARARARDAARQARARHYLEWAVRRAASLAAAAAGSEPALAALGFRGEARHDTHNALRVAMLADGPLDALRVLGSWAFPPAARGRPVNLPRQFLGRLARLRRAAPGRARAYGADPRLDARGVRRLPLDSHELHEVVDLLVASGGRVWARVTGSSMHPTLPSGAVVRLQPLLDRAPAVGDVVLVELAGGGMALHRIRAITPGGIVTQGDGNVNPDRAVPVSALRAIATEARVQGRAVPMAQPLRVRARNAVRTLRSALSPGTKVGRRTETHRAGTPR